MLSLNAIAKCLILKTFKTPSGERMKNCGTLLYWMMKILILNICLSFLKAAKLFLHPYYFRFDRKAPTILSKFRSTRCRPADGALRLYLAVIASNACNTICVSFSKAQVLLVTLLH